MDALIELFQETWAVRALLASTMVGLTCGVLGCFIVLRNMALVGDALSHAILPGVVFAFMIFEYSIIGFFTGSVIAGLIAAVLMTWIQQNVKTKNDAAVGIVFTAMFSIGVIAISRLRVHLDLEDFLFGDALGVSNQDLLLSGIVTLFVIYSVILLYRALFVTTFQPIIAATMGFKVDRMHYFLMLLLSFAVVASLQMVGVILVVAMLITPASTALLLTDRLPKVIALAGIIGMLSAVLGLYFAILYNTTPGPSMAVVATLFYVLAVFLAPDKGLLFQYIRRKRQEVKIQLEDLLKQSFKLQQRNSLSMEGLLLALGINKRRFSNLSQRLRSKGLMEGHSLELTNSGRQEANRLIRAHRLWETYLVNQMGLSADNIHEDAERFEHLLTEDLLDEVEAELGYPLLDPHGSPIPSKRFRPEHSLFSLDPTEFAKIAKKQVDEQITVKLWQLGLLPEMEFQVISKDQEKVEILQQGKQLSLPAALALKVNIDPRE